MKSLMVGRTLKANEEAIQEASFCIEDESMLIVIWNNEKLARNSLKMFCALSNLPKILIVPPYPSFVFNKLVSRHHFLISH